MAGCQSGKVAFQFGKALPLRTKIDTAVLSSGHPNHQIFKLTQLRLPEGKPAQITLESNRYSHDITRKGESRVVIKMPKVSKVVAAKIRNLGGRSTVRHKSATNPQDPNFDFLVVPTIIFFAGILLLLAALIGTAFGGGSAISILAFTGLGVVVLGLIMALIPILSASNDCFYC